MQSGKLLPRLINNNDNDNNVQGAAVLWSGVDSVHRKLQVPDSGGAGLIFQDGNRGLLRRSGLLPETCLPSVESGWFGEGQFWGPAV